MVARNFITVPGEAFSASGAGAVERTVDDKLRDVVSVKDFGAAGDGVTDDTAAIQAAATACSSNGCLVFPSGAYLVSNDITFQSKTNISVVGFGAKIRQQGLNKKTLYFASCSGVTISGFYLEGLGTERQSDGDWTTSTSYNGVAGIFLYSCTDVKIDSNTIVNHAGGGIRWGGGGTGATNVKITNNTIAGIGGGAAPLKIQYLDAKADLAIGPGGGITTDDTYLVVANNDISGHIIGIYANGGPHVVIDSNNIHDIPGQHGIYLDAVSDVTVTNNVITNIAALGIKNQIGADSVTIENINIANNVVTNTGQSGILLLPVTAYLSTSKIRNASISNNVLKNIDAIGIYCLSTEDSAITGNVINTTGTFGMLLDKCKVNVTGNYVINSAWNGLHIGARGDSIVTGNVFTDCCAGADGSGTTRISYIWGFKASDAPADPRLNISLNYFQALNSVPATLQNAARVSSNVLVTYDSNYNNTTKAFRAEILSYFNPGYTIGGTVLLTTGANANPSTPIYGKGTRQLYGSQDPAAAGMTSYFSKGDIVWNTNVTAGSTVGWVCVTAGSPGTWKTFGAVAA